MFLSHLVKSVLVTVVLVTVSCTSELLLSKSYQVSGKLYMPYVELVEPFIGWFDRDLRASRVDYYGGMVKTFQFDKEGDYGTSYEVAPMTTDIETNVITCFQTNGTNKSPVTLQPVLPDTADFLLIGTEDMNGYQSEKWYKENKVGNKISKYTIWVRWEKSAESPLLKVAIPIRYEMKGYDSLLASHYDHYYLDYDSFSSQKPDPEILQVPNHLTCGGFPGPGKRLGSHFNPMQEFVGGYTEHVDEAWEHFKNTHSKDYGHHKEHTQRKEIFRQNLRLINSHNRKGLGYSLKVNHLTDKSEAERRIRKGRQHSQGPNGALNFPYTEEALASISNQLPENFDWRIMGAVTPVKDQATCGSCWSYATTGTVEGAYFLKTGNLISFSQQALVDCSWGYGNNGCDGGEDWRSYQWIMSHGGIPAEDDYGTYLGADGYCHVNKTQLHAKVESYVNVTASDEAALKVAIFKHGPISVSIDASQPTFDFYGHGVYYEPNCKNDDNDLDHSVLAIGFGNLNGENYWLIKNSWSNYWGNQGYVLMSSKDNNCGVMTSPTYVNLA